MCTIPTPERLRQKDLEFKASLGYVVSLGYIVRPCLKKKKKNRRVAIPFYCPAGKILQPML
jgi:hypothetical protein